jgi:hypothetical protein
MYFPVVIMAFRVIQVQLVPQAKPVQSELQAFEV